MAGATGTATSALDYLNKLTAFLTTDAALVAAGQAWQQVWVSPGPGVNQNVTDRVLRGPGLSNQDNVFIGLRLYADAVADEFYLEIVGMTGVIPSAVAFDQHVNVQPKKVRLFLDAGSMTYWFSANGRRFVALAKISTIYQAAYAGLIMPYATPLSYPVPLYVGGSAPERDGTNQPKDWRSVDFRHQNFPFAVRENITQQNEAGAWLLDPAGSWRRSTGKSDDDGGEIRQFPSRSADNLFNDEFTNRWEARDVYERVTEAYGGGRLLTRIEFIQALPTRQRYGSLDGVFRVPGIGVATEDIVTVGGKPHMVVQNVFRTGIGDYWAFALD